MLGEACLPQMEHCFGRLALPLSQSRRDPTYHTDAIFAELRDHAFNLSIYVRHFIASTPFVPTSGKQGTSSLA